MLDSFSSYIPRAWFDDAGMSKGDRVQKEARSRNERRWKHSATSMFMTVISVAAFAISSLLLTDGAIASNVTKMVAPPGMSPLGRAPGPEATVGQINESFKELFSAFRDGVKLITNDKTLQLAENAAVRRNDRTKGWARKLASDVGDASD